MSLVTMSSLRLATALFLLFASGRLCTASFELYQVEFVDDGMTSTFPIEGVASVPIGGSPPRHFAFNCISTTNGQSLSWGRQDGITITMTQSGLANGVQLNFENPSTSDLTVYVCLNSITQEFVTLNVTDDNPIAIPVEEDGVVDVFVGDTAVVKFYAGGLPGPQPGNITWFYNGSSDFNWGTFSADKRTMTIPNVQVSHAGKYTFRVLLQLFAFKTITSVATTTLNVIAPPSIDTHPVSMTIDEWSQASMTCHINGSLPILVEWVREGGAGFPSTATPLQPITINNYMVEATLLFMEAHVSDEGLYFCNATLQDYPTLHASSQSAQLTVNAKIQLVYTPSGGSAQQISSLHYVSDDSVAFTVDCRGSGNLWWTSPAGDNVSLVPSDSPNQQAVGPLRRTLSFQSWSEELNGLYTCSSDLDGVFESLNITNNNPVVVADESNVRVALNQNATLRVHVAGDPQPEPNDIQWYKNGTEIVTSTFSNDRQLLTIFVTGKDAAGIYECRVTTIKGMSSAYFNVTFPDPPEVMVFPPVGDVLVGNSTSFKCNVTSTLEYTLSWNFNGSPELPEGVIMVNDTVLKIPSAEPSHSGTYSCQADDQVNVRSFEAVLVVNYPPTAMVGITEEDKESKFSHIINEGDIPPSFSCFYNGHPFPEVTWTLASGEPLPSSIKQIHAKDGLLQLQFTSALAYNDPVGFVCTASNALETAQARLELVIRAPPTVFTIVPTSPVVLNTTSPLSFVTPPSHTGLSLTCLARGWPIPEIMLVDENGQALTNSYQSCESGVVSASLILDDDIFKQGAVRCMATNSFGEDSQTMQLYVGEAVAPTFSSSSPSETDGSTTISFTLRMLTSDCLQSDESTTQLNEELQKILLYTVSNSGTVCQSLPSSTVTVTRSFCSREVDRATVFSGTISTSDAALTQQLYTALRDWYRSGPVLFLNDIPYAVDLGCDLLLPADTQSECQIDDTPTTVPTTLSVGPDQDYTMWVIVSATVMGLFVIVILVLFICMCVMCHKSNKAHFKTENWPAGDTELTSSSWKHNSNSSGIMAETYMESSPEYDMPQQVRETLRQESLRRFSSLNVELDRKQLQTSTQDENEAPSPQGLGAPSFQVSLSPVSHPNARPTASSMSFGADHKRGLLNSREDLPLEEQLYQPLATSVDKGHEYAQIIGPASQDYTEIPEKVGGGAISGRRATIANPQSTKPNSSHSYQVNVTTGGRFTSPRVPLSRGPGSTPVLVHVQPLPSHSYAQAQRSQPHSQASVFVSPKAQPYQLPVSSQHNLSTIPAEEPDVPASSSSPRDANREVHKAAQHANRAKSNHVLECRPVDEMSEASVPRSTHSTGDGQLQPWYKGGEADSIPPAVHSHDISPYAVTPNCDIRPNPYQEPCGTKANFRMVQV